MAHSLPARRGDRRAARARSARPEGFCPTRTSSRDAERDRGETGRLGRRSRTTRRARSPAPTSWSPTPGCRWGRRTRRADREAPFGPFQVDDGAARTAAARRDRAALPARPPRRGDHRRGDRRPAVGGVGRGREPAARPEGAAACGCWSGRERRRRDATASTAPRPRRRGTRSSRALLARQAGAHPGRAGRAAGRRGHRASPRRRCRATSRSSARSSCAAPTGRWSTSCPPRTAARRRAAAADTELRRPARPAVRRAARLHRRQRQPRGAAHPAGRRAVPRHRHRPRPSCRTSSAPSPATTPSSWSPGTATAGRTSPQRFLDLA